MLLLTIAACGSGAGGAYGPLAVVDDDASGASDALGGTGPLTIDDTCVTVKLDNGEQLLPVWRDSQVTWSDGKIAFEDAAGGSVTIEDGDVVTVSGESLRDDGAAAQAPSPTWVSPPNEDCAGERFMVHGISVKN